MFTCFCDITSPVESVIIDGTIVIAIVDAMAVL